MLLLLGCLAVLARRASQPVVNTDIYFHLRFGHEFLTEWSLRDPGSVTRFATNDWVPTQWSAQMLMAAVEKHLGPAGVSFYVGLTSIVFTVATYLVCRSRAPATVAAFVTIVTVIAASVGLSGRPQVISYVLILITTWAWLRSREDLRPRWWLVPLTWLWVTAHGMWPIGILLGCAAVVGIVLDTRPAGRAAVRLAAVPVLSAVAAALTPLGLRAYAAVANVGGITEYFSEWQPPDFTEPFALTLGIALTLTYVVLLRRPQPVCWTDILLLLLATAFAVYAVRTLAVAAVILAPLLASALQLVVPGRTNMRRGELAGVLLSAVLVLTTLGMVVPRTASDGPDQPAWVDPALGSLPAGTAVANDWGWGGYLMWRYPHLQLLAHGYGDTFTEAELDRNSTILGLEPGWDRLLRETGAEVALLPPDSPLAYTLRTGYGWRVVHGSENVQLLHAPDGW